MQDKIKRYFWIVPVIAVVLCAFYAAKAAAHIAEAKFLGDAKTAPPPRTMRAATAFDSVKRCSTTVLSACP